MSPLVVVCLADIFHCFWTTTEVYITDKKMNSGSRHLYVCMGGIVDKWQKLSFQTNLLEMYSSPFNYFYDYTIALVTVLYFININ